MELEDYCRNVQIELTGWKAKVYDVTRKLDKLSSGDKEKIMDELRDLHIIVEELSDRIFRLEKECPLVWEPTREEIQNKLEALGYKWEEAWGTVAAGNIGG